MKTINLSQIPRILDNALSDYLHTGKTSNILFYGQEGSGRSSTIEDWYHNCMEDLNFLQSVYPEALCIEENGLLIPKTDSQGRKEYVIADKLVSEMTKEKTMLLEKRMNYGKNKEQLRVLFDLIRNREYTTMFNKYFDLRNLFLVVATAFPNDGLNRVCEIEEEDLELFDIYHVKPTLDEVSRYLINENNRIIEMMKEDPEESDDIDKYKLQNNLLQKFVGSDLTFPSFYAPCKFQQMITFHDSPLFGFDGFLKAYKANDYEVDAETLNFINYLNAQMVD